MKDTLFVFRPGFDDHGTTYFCPFSAQVVGFLAYYPAILDTVDVIEIDFPKPRHPLVDLVGEGYQSAPMLVLAADPVAPPPNVTIGHANGHAFVEKTMQILRYLAATRSVPGPH
ncbi:DUF3088 family protein [soil metagenome]